MSDWTHLICPTCWAHTRPGRNPVKMKHSLPDSECCFCGAPCLGEIYVRADPSTLPCRGTEGPEHQEDE